MRNMKCYVMNRGMPPPQKKIKKTSVYLFYSLSFSLSISVYPSGPPPSFHHQPPPQTLTLACLSGLLPCIPPFPVWPLSQEVAQLVDKHHGGDGEEGLGFLGGSGGGWGHQLGLCGLRDRSSTATPVPCVCASALPVKVPGICDGGRGG